MTDRPVEPPVEIELDEARIRVKASGIIRLLEARERFHERLRKHVSTADQAPEPPSAA